MLDNLFGYIKFTECWLLITKKNCAQLHETSVILWVFYKEFHVESLIKLDVRS